MILTRQTHTRTQEQTSASANADPRPTRAALLQTPLNDLQKIVEILVAFRGRVGFLAQLLTLVDEVLRDGAQRAVLLLEPL